MRASCLDCARKHLGQASVLMDEALLGYPEHKWLAVGHLAEAESELLERYPDAAHAIREWRVAYIKEDVSIPILEIIREINDLSREEMPRIGDTTGAVLRGALGTDTVGTKDQVDGELHERTAFR